MNIRGKARVKPLDQIMMSQLAALPPPENADFSGKAAIEKVVGFPDPGNNNARADAYRLRIAAAGHNDEVLIVFNERDL